MKKKMFSTQVKNELLKEFKKLAIDLERPINDVLEEAMLDLLEKYGIEFKVETQGRPSKVAADSNVQGDKRKSKDQ
ncbi:MAG: hypothetical protein JRH08_01995 [Deltaproteobacteria bacterium]|nr:hypothetical protein [Deltaproteobacteria bacterium]MBW1928292.1 hypothetical protein [Deltaproteobacteria bacterium]MBW2025036.1 hypothetical protein [Deltaproteobacteria bacterium]MBW2124471.1 hypothetical protein [Deltaproteobacteria bacterium]